MTKYNILRGDKCEILKCNEQPNECKTFNPMLCSELSVRYHCPNLCGDCKTSEKEKTTTDFFYLNENYRETTEDLFYLE